MIQGIAPKNFYFIFLYNSLLYVVLGSTKNDWGILSNEDKEFQKELLKIPNSRYTERLMGVYVSNKTKIWIISEYDYSIKSLLITILLPEEY